MPIERPLDFLNSLKQKKVVVEKKGENSVPLSGILLAFDIHINLVVETSDGTKFIRGDVIESVTPAN